MDTLEPQSCGKQSSLVTNVVVGAIEMLSRSVVKNVKKCHSAGADATAAVSRDRRGSVRVQA